MSTYTLDYYNEKATAFVEGTQKVDFSHLQNEFASYVTPSGRILDLGCGSGRDSKAFLDMGYSVTAVDGSSAICKIASDYIGQNVICSTFQEYEPDGLLDGIWACASLLHLPMEDIQPTIKKYAAYLQPGGTFYVSFKYGTFSGERNGRFFTDMNEDSFSAILKEIPELRIEKQFISEDVRPGREVEKWLNVFLKKD